MKISSKIAPKAARHLAHRFPKNVVDSPIRLYGIGVKGPIMENQMEKKMENEMETRLYRGYMVVSPSKGTQ